MLIKRCEIDGITVDIEIEDGESTKGKQTLVLMNLLKFLVEEGWVKPNLLSCEVASEPYNDKIPKQVQDDILKFYIRPNRTKNYIPPQQ